MRILIVDDAAVNLFILETVLKGGNYEVVAAADGVEALERLRQGTFDMIVSDILMPRMDGFQLCRECKNDPALRDVPFLFYTGTYTETKDRDFALSLGADRFIVKPMESKDFLAIIADVAAGPRPEGAEGESKPAEKERVYLKEYNERVVSKLEQKMLELQQLNRTLQENEARINNSYVTQRIINQLFHTSQEEVSPQVILEKAIGQILTLPWLLMESAGCIHIVEGGPDILVMKAQKGLEEPVCRECSRVSFGRCLCGAAARTGETQFAARFDERHERPGPEIVPHGHYCVPILYAGRPLGVISVRLPEGHVRDPQEEDSLAAIADTLAGIIVRKRAEKERSDGYRKLRASLQATIQAMALTVEVRDPCTSGHQRRVANLARAIAAEMGLEQDSVEGIHVAGLIHDLGKISVPAEILSKPTKLTGIELDLIKVHPKAGYDILKEIEFQWPVAHIIYQHHERLDGSGYPEGLKGPEICREAKVLAVADVVEAIASHRPYRPAKTVDTALEEVWAKRGALYDPQVAGSCLKLFREKGFRLD